MKPPAIEAIESAVLARARFVADRFGWQGGIVCVVAILVMAVYQYYDPFFFPQGDGDTYLRYGLYLMGDNTTGFYVPIRGPGLPLFYVLSGTLPFKSWLPFIALFAAMSVAIPVMIYFAVAPYDRAAALGAAAVAILTGIPYLYSKTAYPEHLYHFVQFLGIFLVSVFLYRPRESEIWVPYYRNLPYAIALVFFYLYLVRGQGTLYFWIFAAVALAANWPARRQLFRAVALYVALMTTWSLADRELGNVGVPVNVGSSAEARFAEAYFSAPFLAFDGKTEPSISRDAGPASRGLYELVRQYLEENRKDWTTPSAMRPAELYGRYADDPARLVQRIFEYPNSSYYNFIAEIVRWNDHRGAEELYRDVAGEHGTAGIVGVANFLLKRPTLPFLGPMSAYGPRNLLGLLYLYGRRTEQHRTVTLEQSFSYEIDVDRMARFADLTSKVDVERVFRYVHAGRQTLIAEKNGPATREFFQAIKTYLHAFPDKWKDDFIGRLANGDPQLYFRMMFDPLDSRYDGWLEANYYIWIAEMFGQDNAARLFNKVAREGFAANPMAYAIIWDNFLRITVAKRLGDVSGAVSSHFLGNPESREFRAVDFGGLPESMRDGVMMGTYHARAPVAALWSLYNLFQKTNFVFFVASLVLVPVVLFSKARHFGVFLYALYFYNAAGIAVYGNFGGNRYEDVFQLFPVLLTFIGIGVLAAHLGSGRRWTAFGRD